MEALSPFSITVPINRALTTQSSTARNTSANPNHGFYDPSKSSTAHIVDGGSWQETFNTETVGGPVYHDDVTLGSVDASQAVVFPCDSRYKPGDYANFGKLFLQK